MELLQLVESLFKEYGYIVLLFGLPLDAIALPIPPGNTTLTYAGYLSYKDTLNYGLVILCAYAGVNIGITITYILGYVIGMPILEKYGKWIFLKSKHIEKTRQTYEKYGNRMLFFSFFIPGVRQFNGYFAGIIRIPFRTFSLFAYSGALAWVLVFTGIGYFFGNQWKFIFTIVQQFFLYFSLLFLLVIIILFIRKWKNK